MNPAVLREVITGELTATRLPDASLDRVLHALVAHLRRFVYLPRATQYDALAVWCAHTHAIDACEYSPILYLTSAVPRCGKSRVLEAIEHVVARPWKVTQPSESVLFRKIDDYQPTLLLDEADTTFHQAAKRHGDTEPVRAILNAGNRRGTTVPRTVKRGGDFECRDFRIFGAKAIAGIGDLPATVIDRSITIMMERKRPEDRVERLRLREIEALGRPLHDALEDLLARVDSLTVDPNELPDALDDRAQDGWEPLFSIAALAGGGWPDRIRAAALDLATRRASHADEDPTQLLLADCREAFGGDDNVSSTTLVERLCAIPDSPWSTLRGDRPITARWIAVNLRRFRIVPRRERTGSRYYKADFVEAWDRYLDTSATSATTATGTQHDADGGPAGPYAAPVADEAGELPPELQQSYRPPSPREPVAMSVPIAGVADVAAGNGSGATAWDLEAPVCSCGKRKRRIPVGAYAGTFVCTFPHRPLSSAE